jgi:hypothetical protein
MSYEHWKSLAYRAASKIEALEAQVAGLRKALEWYASDEAWTTEQTELSTGDYGDRALAALANCPAPADAQGVDDDAMHEALRSAAVEANRQRSEELKRSIGRPADAQGVVKNICDCERSHNGIGIAGRECDCPAGNPADAQGVEPVELIERLLNRAANARREGTATALGDALHFEEAAQALRALSTAPPPDQARREALEEAAKVAEGEAYGFPLEHLTEHGVGYERACKEIAAAIRAIASPAPAAAQKGDEP